MKMVKSLILGSAAGLVAMSGAQAADLPVKAKAVEYVRICSLYGAGFYYIPGTDTCIKLGGYLRAEIAANTNSVYTGNTSAPGGLYNRYTNGYTWRSREDLNIDTRTATEYGVVRTFFDSTFTWTGDTYNASGTNPLATVYSQLGATGVAAPNNAGAGNTSYGTLGVYYAFIQFAGFTMGKAVSPFDAPFGAYPGNNFDGLVGGGGTITGVNQFTYTAQFGGGFSGTIAAVDQTAYMQAGVLNLGAAGLSTIPGTGVGFASASDYAGTVAPDIVANFDVNQVWGVFKFSAAVHDNHVAYYNNATGAGLIVQSGHPDDKWGFAVQGLSRLRHFDCCRRRAQRFGRLHRRCNPVQFPELVGWLWCLDELWWFNLAWNYRLRWNRGCPRHHLRHRHSAAVDPDLGYARCV